MRQKEKERERYLVKTVLTIAVSLWEYSFYTKLLVLYRDKAFHILLGSFTHCLPPLLPTIIIIYQYHNDIKYIIFKTVT